MRSYLAGSLLAGGVLACSLEDVESRYETFAQAEADGAVQRGWVPDFVPESSFQLRERHNLDTNEIWLSFKFVSSELGFLRSVCPATPEPQWPRRPPGWWPASLSEKQSPPNRFFIGRCEFPITAGGSVGRRVGFIALDSEHSRAWYWE